MTASELQGWMRDRGVSVARLAGELGINVSTLRRWLSGETEPPPFLALALEALERQPQYVA